MPRFGNHRRQSGNLKHAEKPDIRYTPVYTCLQTFVKKIQEPLWVCFAEKLQLHFFYNNMSNTDRSFQENRTSDSFQGPSQNTGTFTSGICRYVGNRYFPHFDADFKMLQLRFSSSCNVCLLIQYFTIYVTLDSTVWFFRGAISTNKKTLHFGIYQEYYKCKLV